VNEGVEEEKEKSSSELSKKTTQAMKNFHLQILPVKAGKHMSTDIDNCTTTFSEA
jgi:hypothetical protein